MGFLIFLAIVALIVLIIIRKTKASKARKIPVYTEYYARKRVEFPWLENWIKENGDPSVERASEFMASKDPSDYVCFRNGDTEHGLTLECPSCGCPHSWVMTEKEVIVETKSEKIKEITTTRKGAGEDWGFGRGDVTTRSSKFDGYVYTGRSIKNFKCLNCGHTEQNEYNEEWNTNEYSRVEPESWHSVFDPPIQAWSKSK